MNEYVRCLKRFRDVNSTNSPNAVLQANSYTPHIALQPSQHQVNSADKIYYVGDFLHPLANLSQVSESYGTLANLNITNQFLY